MSTGEGAAQREVCAVEGEAQGKAQGEGGVRVRLGTWRSRSWHMCRRRWVLPVPGGPCTHTHWVGTAAAGAGAGAGAGTIGSNDAPLSQQQHINT